jgi:hypothetical protein
MLVYKYLNAEYGLQAIRNRRIKIARLMELNDPFEFLGCNLQDRNFRRSLLSTKQELSTNNGLICFSRTWRNPVMWAHYADNHKGICLGFEVNDEFLREVDYVPERPSPPKNLDEAFMMSLLYSKFSHWRYEQEMRVYVKLDKGSKINGMYFYKFNNELKLRKIIVGSNSEVSRADVNVALSSYSTKVQSIKARPAFGRFKIVTQIKKSLWQ